MGGMSFSMSPLCANYFGASNGDGARHDVNACVRVAQLLHMSFSCQASRTLRKASFRAATALHGNPPVAASNDHGQITYRNDNSAKTLGAFD